MNGRELRGENVSLPHNWGSNKTSCGACGSAGEELSQDERWHTDETKIADTDETKIADTWDYYQQWEYINRMAGEGKNILPLLARSACAPRPFQPHRTSTCRSGCPASLVHSHILLPLLPQPAVWNGIFVPHGTGQVLGQQTPHQFLVHCKTAYGRSQDHLLLFLSS